MHIVLAGIAILSSTYGVFLWQAHGLNCPDCSDTPRKTATRFHDQGMGIGF
jgi:hypothetical protein